MASNNILKLQVDDKQYEASLKSAQQGLQALMNALRNSGKSFSDLDKNTEQYVRALGNMEATAKNTRGRIGEMSSAFVELSQVEKQLTDQERQSPVGKALTESLNQLKHRTIDAKNELQGLENQIKNVGEVKLPDTGGLFGGGKLDGMLQVFGGNMMTKAAGAIASLGTEMFNSVQQGIELAKQGEGIRVAFERLGNGQILDGLREATHGTVTDIELMKAAVKFNDFKLPVEELGTMLAFAQQKAKDTGQSVDYMVDSIVTGLGRKSLMILDNLGLSATEVKDKMKDTGDMTKAVGQIIREQMAKAGDYVETAADRAAQANVSLQNKMEELGRKFAPLEEASNSLWTSMKIGILDIIGGPLATLLNQLTQAGRIRNEMQNMGGSESVNKQLGALRLAKGRGATGYMSSRYNQDIADYQKQISDLDFKIAAFGKGRDSIERGHIERLKEQKAAVQALMAEYKQGAQQIMNATNVANAAVTGGTPVGGGGRSGKVGSSKGFDISSIAFDANKAGLAAAMSEEEPSEIWKAITEGAKESKNSVEELTAALEALNEAEGVTVKDTKKDSKELGKNWKDAGSAILAVGSAMSQIEDPAAKVIGTIAQAVATVALTFASSLKGTVTPWDWIAAAAAGTATMISTISAIHSATGYASGGVIKGNSYSGDNIMGMVDGGGIVGLNAGEIVLNKAQTANVANELTNNQPRAMRVNGRISGHDIVLAADRSLVLEGKGHMLTWK